MVRNQQQWDLGEPKLNGSGQPTIHSIAQKLSCIRPIGDIHLPISSNFSEDAEGLAKLARLEEQHQNSFQKVKTDNSSAYRMDEVSSRLRRFDIEQTNCEAAPGSDNDKTSPPLSFLSYNAFQWGFAPYVHAGILFNSEGSFLFDFSSWAMPKTTPNELMMPVPQRVATLRSMDSVTSHFDQSGSGANKLHSLSSPISETMINLIDQIVYNGDDGEPI